MKNRTFLIAGNWKMNTLPSEGVELAKAIATSQTSAFTTVEVLVCPPSTHLSSVLEAVGTSGIKVGAQNMHQHTSGAYTGEISAAMIQAIGCTHVILGHSERRQYFGETDALINHKIKQALAHNLTPIVCIGETFDEREAGQELEVVTRQVEGALAELSTQEAEKLVWAYEPVWAIGTGKTATPAQAQTMHAAIRNLLASLVNKQMATQARLLYGGSLNAVNAPELLAQVDIDGGLIGGASLKSADFGTIIQTAYGLSA
ncbi:MAG: triose-phosphate isomerase [Rhodothermia bacterium]|nr:triose-phosphate isomerase [Rhodothermia bacterium]